MRSEGNWIMQAITRHRWVTLTGLACVALVLAGCEPPPMPAAGGLVSTSQPAAPETDGLQLGAPLPTAAAQAEPEYAPPPVFSAEADATSQPALPAAPAAASTPLIANPGLIPVDQANSGGAPKGNGPSSARSTAPPPTRNTSIRLSAGVALPQSLPTGTAMGMSIDYAFAGGLNQSSRYLWVISSEGGGEVETEVNLAVSGTLQSFFLKLRPEHKPFNCRIEEVLPGGRRVRVSNVAPMQTSY
jgi:hypothetical protein